jgi:hypothetical protein
VAQRDARKEGKSEITFALTDHCKYDPVLHPLGLMRWVNEPEPIGQFLVHYASEVFVHLKVLA